MEEARGNQDANGLLRSRRRRNWHTFPRFARTVKETSCRGSILIVWTRSIKFGRSTAATYVH